MSGDRFLQSGEIGAATLRILATTPSTVRALLEGAPASAVESAVDDGWSAKDVVAHLLDTEGIAFVERITRILTEERPFIRSIEPSTRLDELGLRHQSLAQLLDDLANRRASDLAWLQSLTTEQLARVGEHDEAGEITAGNIAHVWAFHDLMHIEQICKILQAAPLTGMGNTRRFYFTD